MRQLPVGPVTRDEAAVTTERLYYRDSRLTTFQARVVDRSPDATRVLLDRTAFYPTSGGQPHDTGVLGERQVVDVVDGDDGIVHVLDGPLAGESVTGSIDWPRRFDHMQQHTGQHVLSAVFDDLFGFETVSVHFGPTHSTLDLGASSVEPSMVRRAEATANEAVTGNRPVGVTLEDGATASGLRKAAARQGELRIVTIEGLDRSACGGTHVRATGEIGLILLRRQERVKKGVRIEFLCGLRAVARARADYDALADMARSMSASTEEVPALVAAQVDEVKALAALGRKREAELVRHQAADRYRAVPAGPDGRRVLAERRADGLEAARAFGLAFASLEGGVYVATCEQPPSVLVATAPDSGLVAGAWLRSRLAEVGGRGGGSARLAQGSVPSRDALDAFERAILPLSR